MAREDPHFRLRIPEELKARIEAASLEARRSINAEIVARLEASFDNRAARSSLDQVALASLKDIVAAPYIGELERERLDRIYADLKREETEIVRRYMAAVTNVLRTAAKSEGKAE